MLKKVISKYKSQGIDGLYRSARKKIIPYRAVSYGYCSQFIRNNNGLEIGGPSSIFKDRGELPFYTIAKSLDNCNFSNNTVWEGQLVDGADYKIDSSRAMGRQYVSEASALSQMASGSYNFLISSHVLEHVANPIKALYEWCRVLKPGGTMVVILPHKDGTFDHRRVVTSLEHMIEDYENDVDESDLSHLQEILIYHDVDKDQGVNSISELESRSNENYMNRCLHHHVFDMMSAAKLFDYVGLKLAMIEGMLPYHIILVAHKKDESTRDNLKFLTKEADAYKNSPFVSDRCS